MLSEPSLQSYRLILHDPLSLLLFQTVLLYYFIYKSLAGGPDMYTF